MSKGIDQKKKMGSLKKYCNILTFLRNLTNYNITLCYTAGQEKRKHPVNFNHQIVPENK